MPYAIYSLNIDGQAYHEFVSFKKTKHQVLGDVIAFLVDEFKGINDDIDYTPKMLGADLCLLGDEMGEYLKAIDLQVLEVMDKATEEKIDILLDFVANSREMLGAFSFHDNREAEILLSQLDFGVRRCLDRRFSRFRLDSTDEDRAEDDKTMEWYTIGAGLFKAMLQYGFDEHRFEEIRAKHQILSRSEIERPEAVVGVPGQTYIWWTTQGDCEGTMDYHSKARFEGKLPWGGEIPDDIMSNLSSRNGRHARGTVWGLETQPTFDNSDWHRYIQKNCGGVVVRYEDLRTIRSNLGFVTDLNLKLQEL
ncbi:hypothetical protein D3C81_334960 [compost metagenome]